MKQYLVTWQIDIWAESPLEAAQRALAYQRDPNSKAVVFDVHYGDGEVGETNRVDLLDNSVIPT